MEKIPTLFERGYDHKVIDKITKGCEWVKIPHQALVTEKLDGINVRLTVRSERCVRVEKRRNPTKVQKNLGIVEPWYVDADEFGKEDKWIFDAVKYTNLTGWPDGEHSCEAIGPNIQGNPLGLEYNRCVPFNRHSAIPIYRPIDITYEGIKSFLESLDSLYSPGHLAEGIVFHNSPSDGSETTSMNLRAKIKRKDFSYGQQPRQQASE